MKKIVKDIPKACFLIDILSDSSFAREHIKGATNFSVYEIAFIDKVKEAIPDENQTICVYGWSDKTEEAKRALQLLENAGYKNVHILAGGLEKWKAENRETKKGDGNGILDGDFLIDPKESIVEWVGRNIGKTHRGTVNVRRGNVYFDKGILLEGQVVLNMQSIRNTDLERDYREYLENHLKGEDFFDAISFPEAKIKIVEVRAIDSIKSRPNCDIKAKLTLKGIEQEVLFPAFVHEKDGKMTLNAHFDIDRTLWGVKYGSEKFFSKLGIHVIDDMISLDITLFGKKA